MHYRTIVISDLHLGTKDSQYKRVLNFLQNNTTENLILNGDIIDGRYLKIFGRRPKEHSCIIAHIINLAKEGKTNITYLIGNHDEFWKDIIQLTLSISNIKFGSEIIYESGNKKFYISHGHIFDKYESTLYGLGTISFILGTRLYAINRSYNYRRVKRGLKPVSIVKEIKQIAKKIMVGGNDNFYKKVEELCKKKHVDGLICGHLHKAEITQLEHHLYLNCGDGVSSCTALVESENHERKLIYY